MARLLNAVPGLIQAVRDGRVAPRCGGVKSFKDAGSWESVLSTLTNRKYNWQYMSLSYFQFAKICNTFVANMIVKLATLMGTRIHIVVVEAVVCSRALAMSLLVIDL